MSAARVEAVDWETVHAGLDRVRQLTPQGKLREKVVQLTPCLPDRRPSPLKLHQPVPVSPCFGEARLGPGLKPSQRRR